MPRKTISNTFIVNTVEDGKRGRIGRFYYYAGVWSNTSGSNFKVTDAQAPLFEYTNPTTHVHNYWVFNPQVNGTYTMAQMGEPSSLNENWQLATDDFSYLITEAIFSNFAHFGSAIISGDWMISQYGTINGQTSQNFQAFDSQHPNDDVGTNFIPNYCVNLNTGDSYQHHGVFSGFIRKKKVIITNSNYNEYARQVGQSTRLDFDKCGTFIEFQMNEFPRALDLPILCWYYSPSREGSGVTQERTDDIRSYVGTKCIIYNNSGTTYNIDLKRNHNGTLSDTYALYDGCCVSIECVLGYDEVTSQGTTTRYENIYWIASDYDGIHRV